MQLCYNSLPSCRGGPGAHIHRHTACTCTYHRDNHPFKIYNIFSIQILLYGIEINVWILCSISFSDLNLLRLNVSAGMIKSIYQILLAIFFKSPPEQEGPACHAMLTYPPACAVCCIIYFLRYFKKVSVYILRRVCSPYFSCESHSKCLDRKKMITCACQHLSKSSSTEMQLQLQIRASIAIEATK